MVPKLQTLSLTTFCDFLVTLDPHVFVPWENVSLGVRKLILSYFAVAHTLCDRYNLFTESFLANNDQYNLQTMSKQDTIFVINLLRKVDKPLPLGAFLIQIGGDQNVDQLNELIDLLNSTTCVKDLCIYTGSDGPNTVHFDDLCRLYIPRLNLTHLTYLRMGYCDVASDDCLLINPNNYPNLEKIRIPWKALNNIKGTKTVLQFLKSFPHLNHINLDMQVCLSYVREISFSPEDIRNTITTMKIIEKEGITISINFQIYQYPQLYGEQGWRSVTKETGEIIKESRKFIEIFGSNFAEIQCNSIQDDSILTDVGLYCNNLENFSFLHQNFHGNTDGLVPIFENPVRAKKLTFFTAHIRGPSEPFVEKIWPLLARNCCNLTQLNIALHREQPSVMAMVQEETCNLIKNISPLAMFHSLGIPRTERMNNLIKLYLPAYAKSFLYSR